MKQSLSMKLGQQLKMTPQLQQAIKLLQLSAMELSQEIQTTLDSNPLLEVEDDWSDNLPEVDDSTDNYDNFDAEPAPIDDFPDAQDLEQDVGAQLSEPLSETLEVDSSWDDVYPQAPAAAPASGEFDLDPGANNVTAPSLIDHLEWQLNLTPMAPSDRVVAMAIIDAIDTDGMLSASIEEIRTTLFDPNLTADDQVNDEDIIQILGRVQQFDPIGVGARDLRECLLLQLMQLDPATQWLKEAISVVDQHLDLLGAKDFVNLIKRTRLQESQLSEIVVLIRTLQPRPGAAFDSADSDFVLPDVVVRKQNNRWLVELNPETLPKVRINDTYAGYVKNLSSGADKDFIKDNLQEARWFLKSLQTRHDTLLKVATKIVEVQQGFLEHGPEAMKPLILADIAEQVELHESTISRVTNRKYLATPRGLFELKYFFSSHVGTASGGEVSSTAIRAIIKKLTAEENPRKPLSDSKIAVILKEQNITVARRTVAKYRESLSIPPSNERKQLV
ncbi:RNA polymerase factor sigma-54 [Pseudomonadales bacterium]|nr:RNA polymerase factor sigma-54 [Pseudomonadales bacterium]